MNKTYKTFSTIILAASLLIIPTAAQATETPEPDVCLNIAGEQTEIPEGMEAGPAVEGGPTCVEADLPCPGFDVCPVDELVDLPMLPVPDDLAYTGSPSPLVPAGFVLLLFVAGVFALRKVTR
jgi:hypothetical protein